MKRLSKYLSVVFLAAFVVALAVTLWPKAEEGQGETTEPSDTVTPNSDELTVEDAVSLAGLELVGSLDPEHGEPYTYILDADSSLFIKEGELAFTVTGAKVVTNIHDMPEGILDNENTFVSVGGKDYCHPYPPFETTLTFADHVIGDYVLEDGSLIPGMYIVTVDLRLENRNAASYIVGEDEKHFSFWGEPYLFWTEELIDIEILEWDGTELHRWSRRPRFFSEYGKAINELTPEKYEGTNRWAVRVEPGEIRDITLGYIMVPEDAASEVPDPECLFAIGKTAITEVTYLGLHWPEQKEAEK